MESWRSLEKAVQRPRQEPDGTRAFDPYAVPREVTSLEECYFYHTMDIPGFGHVKGEWDLRGRERAYLGNVGFNKKRVLEIGAASGFLSFFMESQGADVVGFDLSERDAWDIVPYAGYDYYQRIQEFKAHIRQLNNGYWLAHKAFNSKARMVYGTVYEIPLEIGPVDIATFGSILLHVRDPFLALQNALRLARETVIITDIAPDRGVIPLPRGLTRFRVLRAVANRVKVPLKLHTKLAGPSMVFLPQSRQLSPDATWWLFNPEILRQFVGVLGFEETKVTYHNQKWRGIDLPVMTIVGRRTRPMSDDL